MNRRTRPTVLHVVERPSAVSGKLDRAAERAAFDVEHVETVYSAMARLVRDGSAAARAVLVCVDSLDAPDLEFFALMGRHRPEIPVYIYGQSVDGHRRQRALALGARCAVSPADIETLLETLAGEQARREPEPPEQPGPARDRRELDQVVLPFPTPRPSEDALPEPYPPELITAEESDTFLPDDSAKSNAERIDALTHRVDEHAEPASSSSPVPTPWHPSANRPQRIPPGQRRPAESAAENPSEDEAVPHGNDERGEDESLLSPQEVNALLSESQEPTKGQEGPSRG